MEIYRQGDVLLIKRDRLSEGQLIPIPVDGSGRIVLAYGEVTGHAHAIADTAKARLWDAGAERFLQVLEKTALVHEEHAPIQLEKGVYEVRRQREWDASQDRLV